MSVLLPRINKGISSLAERILRIKFFTKFHMSVLLPFIKGMSFLAERILIVDTLYLASEEKGMMIAICDINI